MTDLMRYDIIQRLIDHHGYKSYLEIGIHKGNTWNRIRCERKIGCDPEKHVDDIGIHDLTSDKFFETIAGFNSELPLEAFNFDIVFIDGLHRAEQVWKDIRNSLKFLNPGGCIVLHDCNPPTLAHAGPEPEIFKKPLPSGEPHFVWCGTVWKITQLLNAMLDEMFTVNTDWGVTVIFPENGTIEEYSEPYLYWEFFDENRQEILNLITVDEFNRRFPVKG